MFRGWLTWSMAVEARDMSGMMAGSMPFVVSCASHSAATAMANWALSNYVRVRRKTRAAGVPQSGYVCRGKVLIGCLKVFWAIDDAS